MKRTINDFKKDVEVGEIMCPRCHKCSVFRLRETKEGYMKFICHGCEFGEVMPFKRTSK